MHIILFFFFQALCPSQQFSSNIGLEFVNSSEFIYRCCFLSSLPKRKCCIIKQFEALNMMRYPTETTNIDLSFSSLRSILVVGHHIIFNTSKYQ